jgi:hypothetical protein
LFELLEDLRNQPAGVSHFEGNLERWNERLSSENFTEMIQEFWGIRQRRR